MIQRRRTEDKEGLRRGGKGKHVKPLNFITVDDPAKRVAQSRAYDPEG